MRRTRARLLAVAVVAGSALGSAYAGMVIDPVAPSSGQIPVNSADQLFFSIKNTGTSAFSITGLTPQTVVMFGTATDGCPSMTLAPVNYTYGSPIAPGAAVELAVATNGFPAVGTYACTYSIATNPAMTNPTVTATFNVSGTADAFDLQPTSLDFGTVSTFAQQMMSVTNYAIASPSLTISIANDPSNVLSFVSPCSGGHNCTFVTPAPGSSQQVNVKCTASTSTVASALLQVFGSGGVQVGSDVTVACDTVTGSGSGSGMLVLMPDPIQIFPPPGGMASASTTASTGDPTVTMLTSEGLSGTDLSAYGLADCGGATSCSGLTFPLSTTAQHTLAVSCNLAVQPAPPPATLTVMDDAGELATASVSCGSGSGSGSGVAVLAISPSASFGNVMVGDMGSASVTITNTGDPSTSLDNIVLAMGGTDPGEFFVTTGQCTTSAPCTIPVGGPPLVVPLTFKPTVHGAADATLFATSTGGNGTSALAGTGLGAVMSAPNPADIDFRTIPRGQTFTRTVEIDNTGNFPMPVTFTAPTSPFGVSPTTTQSIGGPGSGSWTVSCGSDTPTGAQVDQTIAINSSNPPTYLGAMQSLTVHCTVADTQIVIAPNVLDFGLENRIGSTIAPITVTVTNPASAVSSSMVSIKLDSQQTGLSLTPATTSQTLNPGDVVTLTLALDSSAETHLDNEYLDVTVDGIPLQIAVTGAVVTPHSRIAPSSLQLGTACIGSQVSGTVMLINDGTATLKVFQPTTDSAFTALAVSPASYPMGGASVAPGTMASTQIVPSASATGMVSGELHWTDDVPSDYHVPVTLDYVANGTAVSPAALDFGSIEVGQPSSSQQITAQNCELTPKPFKVRALRGKDGSAPLGAWKIDPPVGFSTTLGANQVQIITAHFDPPGRGHYEADLELDTDVGPQTVHLVADATGRDFDRTSVYACQCNGGSVSGGWPIVLALILVRRRRGSSSPR